MPSTLRMWLLKRNPRLSIPDGTLVQSGCYFESNPISFGRGVYVNKRVQFYGEAEIRLGENVAVGFDTVFTTTTHLGKFEDHRAAGGEEHPIRIGDGTWIAARVTVLPGTIIGRGCIVAAGAVVRGECQPNGLYAGVPAKRIRDLPTGALARRPGFDSECAVEK
ncbi:acyltransferase [Rosistilla carotiformis]|nr:acyltransferase [Rosistilla carotiformis]